MNLNDKLTEARSEHAREKLIAETIPATKEDYKAWLAAHLEKGGKITHVYDYPFARWDWRIADKVDFEMPLYGSHSSVSSRISNQSARRAGKTLSMTDRPMSRLLRSSAR
jgi:hypothetical protein